MLDENLKLGMLQRSMYHYYQPICKEYGFFESFPAGISHGLNVLSGYIEDLKYVFTREGANSVGSFGAIGSMLAFMNILPIPALDGGHTLFILYEIIFRRKPSERFLERAELIGMGLLILLMIWAVKNDIVNFLL